MSLIQEILSADSVLLDVEVASKKRLLEEIAQFANERYGMDKNSVFDCLFAREKLGSTGLGHGVAIPHGRLGGMISDTVAVFLRLTEPVDFDSPDEKPVSLVFALLVPENATGKHLEVLSHLADVFSSKTAREGLMMASDKETVLNILTQQ
ncbi:MAG: PTS IIA-like nitrogen regulatory protein PtsN [Neisseriaceae bacterium]|nr:PTS IIA-like nitrogen regulatory protein PtsN [Neisseriaceae bacterium]MBR1819163.1 PTS IIA-like nitrogen regulatory protein PtsN [Neisseriaceae bacterium]